MLHRRRHQEHAIPKPLPQLKTKRLVLGPYTLADYDAWRSAYAGKRPKQNRFDSGPAPAKTLTKASFKRVLKRHGSLRDRDHIHILAAFERATGLLVGAVDMLILARMEMQWATLGYQVFNQYWGQGFGTEATRGALVYGFKKLRLNRIESAINLDNPASAKVANRAGMKRECIRKQFYFEHGGWVDHLIYVATPADVGLKSGKPKPE